MPRLPDWEDRLHEYVESIADLKFKYGTHDCCTFSCGAVIAITGIDPMQEFRGQYSSKTSSIRALKSIGNGDLAATFSAKFEEVPLAQAQRGDLVMAQNSIGIVYGISAIFVADKGIELCDRSDWQKAWAVGRDHG